MQPSTNIVRTFSSSATGPSAGVLPLEVMPQKKSIFSDSFSRRQLLDVRVGAGVLVGLEQLDLPLAEQAARAR